MQEMTNIEEINTDEVMTVLDTDLDTDMDTLRKKISFFTKPSSFYIAVENIICQAEKTSIYLNGADLEMRQAYLQRLKKAMASAKISACKFGFSLSKATSGILFVCIDRGIYQACQAIIQEANKNKKFFSGFFSTSDAFISSLKSLITQSVPYGIGENQMNNKKNNYYYDIADAAIILMDYEEEKRYRKNQHMSSCSDEKMYQYKLLVKENKKLKKTLKQQATIFEQHYQKEMHASIGDYKAKMNTEYNEKLNNITSKYQQDISILNKTLQTTQEQLAFEKAARQKDNERLQSEIKTLSDQWRWDKYKVEQFFSKNNENAQKRKNIRNMVHYQNNSKGYKNY